MAAKYENAHTYGVSVPAKEPQESDMKSKRRQLRQTMLEQLSLMYDASGDHLSGAFYTHSKCEPHFSIQSTSGRRMLLFAGHTDNAKHGLELAKGVRRVGGELREKREGIRQRGQHGMEQNRHSARRKRQSRTHTDSPKLAARMSVVHIGRAV